LRKVLEENARLLRESCKVKNDGTTKITKLEAENWAMGQRVNDFNEIIANERGYLREKLAK